MWKCKNCSEDIESNFDACWNCGYLRKGSPKKNESTENTTIPMLPNGELLSEAIKSNSTSRTESVSLSERQEVVIVDVSVPFWSMVVFMVKWAIASIPAILILFWMALLFGGLLGGISASIFK
jgi:hypothetical protein